MSKKGRQFFFRKIGMTPTHSDATVPLYRLRSSAVLSFEIITVFSHAGPESWNSFPADLRSISDCSRFKSKLKTYLFQLAFNIQ